MSRTKIALYLALIFIAGAVAGGAIVLNSPRTFAPERRPRHHGSPEDFAKHLWNKTKERLKLDEGQAQKIEPIFRAGFDEVRKIQERSLQEVEATIQRNHEEIGKLLTEEQRKELQRMNQERRDFFIKRGSKPPHGLKDPSESTNKPGEPAPPAEKS